MHSKWKYTLYAVCLAAFIGLIAVADEQVQAQDLGPSAVESVAYSPDGSKIAVAGGTPICSRAAEDAANYAIRILDANTGELINTVGASTCSVNSVSWSPDGTRIASSSWEGTGFVWDATTGAQVSMYEDSGYGAFSLRNVEWNPVDNRIVIQADSGTYTVIWDAVTGDIIGPDVSDIATFAVGTVTWSPDGNHLAITTLDNKIEIFDVNPVNATLEHWPLLLRFDSGPVYELDWSPDGSRIAGAVGGEVHIFDVTNGQLVQTLTGGTNTLLVVDWSPDGSRIAAGGMDNMARVWDVETSNQVAVFDHLAPVYALDWNPNSQDIAFGGPINPTGDSVNIAEVPSPTPTPSATPTPAAFQRLRVTAICSDDPATSRR